MEKFRLYRLYSVENGFMLKEYKCPKISETINIKIPTKIISNKFIESKDKLYEKGLIPFLLYYASGPFEIDEYIIAKRDGDNYISNCLKMKDNFLTGRIPSWITQIKQYFIMFLFIFIYFLFFLLILNTLI